MLVFQIFLWVSSCFWLDLMKRLLREEQWFPKSSLWDRAAGLPPSSPNYEAVDRGGQRPWSPLEAPGSPVPMVGLQELGAPRTSLVGAWEPRASTQGLPKGWTLWGKVASYKGGQTCHNFWPDSTKIWHRSWEYQALMYPQCCLSSPQSAFAFFYQFSLKLFRSCFHAKWKCPRFPLCVLTVQINWAVQMVAEIRDCKCCRWLSFVTVICKLQAGVKNLILH